MRSALQRAHVEQPRIRATQWPKSSSGKRPDRRASALDSSTTVDSSLRHFLQPGSRLPSWRSSLPAKGSLKLFEPLSSGVWILVHGDTVRTFAKQYVSEPTRRAADAQTSTSGDIPERSGRRRHSATEREGSADPRHLRTNTRPASVSSSISRRTAATKSISNPRIANQRFSDPAL